MGVARALVAELGCAVVAMRYPVIDDFAVRFADALYDRVFRQGQTLDRAVAAAVPAVLGPVPSSARPALSVATPALFGASAAELVLTPPEGKPDLDPEDRVMAGFLPEPLRFVGRAEAMASAGAALAPASGRTAVVFHGMAGGGKTTCALELAYRHQRAFEAPSFWSASTDPEQFGDALRLLAVAWEAQLGNHGFAMVNKIATPADVDRFLPRLRALLQDTGLLLVLDNLETLLTPEGGWRDPRWAPLMDALIGHDGESRVILTSRILPAGLDPDRVLVRPVHALSRDESVLLARELPNLHYVSPKRRSIAGSHHNLANYLALATQTDAEQRAHRLAAALLKRLTGDTHTLTRTLRVLADELRGDTDRPDAPALPTVLSEVIRLVDAGDGVHFGDLVAALCPDPDTADRALAELLATAAPLPEEP